MIESMYGTGVDTLKAARALEKAGFESVQAEALVAAFGGSVAGGAATREDLRDLRNASREESRELRSELKEEIGELRSELKEEIGELRSETRAGFVAVREEMGVMRTDIAELRTEMRTEIVKARSAAHADNKSLKAQMYGLLLAQATLIVSLILGLQRLL